MLGDRFESTLYAFQRNAVNGDKYEIALKLLMCRTNFLAYIYIAICSICGRLFAAIGLGYVGSRVGAFSSSPSGSY